MSLSRRRADPLLRRYVKGAHNFSPTLKTLWAVLKRPSNSTLISTSSSQPCIVIQIAVLQIWCVFDFASTHMFAYIQATGTLRPIKLNLFQFIICWALLQSSWLIFISTRNLLVCLCPFSLWFVSFARGCFVIWFNMCFNACIRFYFTVCVNT